MSKIRPPFSFGLPAVPGGAALKAREDDVFLSFDEWISVWCTERSQAMENFELADMKATFNMILEEEAGAPAGGWKSFTQQAGTTFMARAYAIIDDLALQQEYNKLLRKESGQVDALPSPQPSPEPQEKKPLETNNAAASSLGDSKKRLFEDATSSPDAKKVASVPEDSTTLKPVPVSADPENPAALPVDVSASSSKTAVGESKSKGLVFVPSTGDALAYLNVVRDRFPAGTPTYTSFLAALADFKSKRATNVEAMRRVTELFKNEPDLLEGFALFMPASTVPVQSAAASSSDANPSNESLPTPQLSTAPASFQISTEVDQKCEVRGSVQVHRQTDGPMTAVLLHQAGASLGGVVKFYVMQVLETRSFPRRYYFWTRWGRQDTDGQNQLVGPMDDLAYVTGQFENKFSMKTKNEWVNRKNFVQQPGMYMLSSEPIPKPQFPAPLKSNDKTDPVVDVQRDLFGRPIDVFGRPLAAPQNPFHVAGSFPASSFGAPPAPAAPVPIFGSQSQFGFGAVHGPLQPLPAAGFGAGFAAQPNRGSFAPAQGFGGGFGAQPQLGGFGAAHPFGFNPAPAPANNIFGQINPAPIVPAKRGGPWGNNAQFVNNQPFQGALDNLSNQQAREDAELQRAIEESKQEMMRQQEREMLANVEASKRSIADAKKQEIQKAAAAAEDLQKGIPSMHLRLTQIHEEGKQDYSVVYLARDTMDALQLVHGDTVSLSSSQGRSILCICIGDATLATTDAAVSPVSLGNLCEPLGATITLARADHIPTGDAVAIQILFDTSEDNKSHELPRDTLLTDYIRPFFKDSLRPVRIGDIFPLVSQKDGEQEPSETSDAPVFVAPGGVSSSSGEKSAPKRVWIRIVDVAAPGKTRIEAHSTGVVVADSHTQLTVVAPQTAQQFESEKHGLLLRRQVAQSRIVVGEDPSEVFSCIVEDRSARGGRSEISLQLIRTGCFDTYSILRREHSMVIDTQKQWRFEDLESARAAFTVKYLDLTNISWFQRNDEKTIHRIRKMMKYFPVDITPSKLGVLFTSVVDDSLVGPASAPVVKSPNASSVPASAANVPVLKSDASPNGGHAVAEPRIPVVPAFEAIPELISEGPGAPADAGFSAGLFAEELRSKVESKQVNVGPTGFLYPWTVSPDPAMAAGGPDAWLSFTLNERSSSCVAGASAQKRGQMNVQMIQQVLNSFAQPVKMIYAVWSQEVTVAEGTGRCTPQPYTLRTFPTQFDAYEWFMTLFESATGGSWLTRREFPGEGLWILADAGTKIQFHNETGQANEPLSPAKPQAKVPQWQPGNGNGKKRGSNKPAGKIALVNGPGGRLVDALPNNIIESETRDQLLIRLQEMQVQLASKDSIITDLRRSIEAPVNKPFGQSDAARLIDLEVENRALKQHVSSLLEDGEAARLQRELATLQKSYSELQWSIQVEKSLKETRHKVERTMCFQCSARERDQALSLELDVLGAQAAGPSSIPAPSVPASSMPAPEPGFGKGWISPELVAPRETHTVAVAPPAVTPSTAPAPAATSASSSSRPFSVEMAVTREDEADSLENGLKTITGKPDREIEEFSTPDPTEWNDDDEDWVDEIRSPPAKTESTKDQQ